MILQYILCFLLAQKKATIVAFSSITVFIYRLNAP